MPDRRLRNHCAGGAVVEEDCHSFEDSKICSYACPCLTTQGPSTRRRRPSSASSVIPPACGSSSCFGDGERSVGALQAELGLDSGGTSQHLAALRRIGLVESRRDGTSVYYRVEDERVFDLLATGRGMIARRLAEQQSILDEIGPA